jgi:hypothetical protein
VAREFVDESGKPEAGDTVIGPTGSVADSTGEEAFADTGRSCDDDVEAFADPTEVRTIAGLSYLSLTGPTCGGTVARHAVE